MTAVTPKPRPARAAPAGSVPRRQRCQDVRLGHRGGADPGPIERDSRRTVVLRCPGPLVALRGLAALYRVSAQRLTALLPECEMQARADPDGGAGALGIAVSNALGAPLTPICVHYFHAAWLTDPPGALKVGVLASTTEDAPRACLVRDVLLRPALYGTPDPFELPPFGQDPARPCRSHIGADVTERHAPPATPCIVEYRRRPARHHADVDVALWFVAAAMRGSVSPWAVGGRGAEGEAIAAHDIVSVRAITTQAEWALGDRGP